MQRNADAYGQEIWAYFRGENVVEIVERDDGYVNVSSGPRTYFAGYRDWASHERRALRYVRGRVLDIGCGAGRVALELQRRGYRVTAIDRSPLAIKVCRARGVRHAIVRPIEALSRFPAQSFATVILFGNNFGLFSGRALARRLLRQLDRITTPRALILAESHDPYRTTDAVHLRYHRHNLRRGRMAGQLRLRIRFKSSASHWFDYLIVSKTEMRQLLEGTGWQVIKFLDHDHGRYIAVIAKAK